MIHDRIAARRTTRKQIENEDRKPLFFFSFFFNLFTIKNTSSGANTIITHGYYHTTEEVQNKCKNCIKNVFQACIQPFHSALELPYLAVTPYNVLKCTDLFETERSAGMQLLC